MSKSPSSLAPWNDPGITHRHDCYRNGSTESNMGAGNQESGSAVSLHEDIKPYTRDLGDSAHLPDEMTSNIYDPPSHACYTHLPAPAWSPCNRDLKQDQDHDRSEDKDSHTKSSHPSSGTDDPDGPDSRILLTHSDNLCEFQKTMYINLGFNDRESSVWNRIALGTGLPANYELSEDGERVKEYITQNGDIPLDWQQVIEGTDRFLKHLTGNPPPRSKEDVQLLLELQSILTVNALSHLTTPKDEFPINTFRVTSAEGIDLLRRQSLRPIRDIDTFQDDIAHRLGSTIFEYYVPRLFGRIHPEDQDLDTADDTAYIVSSRCQIRFVPVAGSGISGGTTEYSMEIGGIHPTLVTPSDISSASPLYPALLQVLLSDRGPARSRGESISSGSLIFDSAVKAFSTYWRQALQDQTSLSRLGRLVGLADHQGAARRQRIHDHYKRSDGSIDFAGLEGMVDGSTVTAYQVALDEAIEALKSPSEGVQAGGGGSFSVKSTLYDGARADNDYETQRAKTAGFWKMSQFKSELLVDELAQDLRQQYMSVRDDCRQGVDDPVSDGVGANFWRSIRERENDLLELKRRGYISGEIN